MRMPSLPFVPSKLLAGRRWLLYGLLPLGAAGLAAGGYWGWTELAASRGQAALVVKWQPVTVGEMEVKVRKEGDLQAVNNIEIMSMVEGVSTIVQIVKEGATVNAGDVLVQLDSSLIRQRIDDTALEQQRSETDLAAARNALEIQKSQNDANLETVEVDLQLAKLTLQQYLDGTFPQDLETADTTLRMNKIMQDNKADDLKQIKDLYDKNFVNLADVKQAELALETTRNDVVKAQVTLRVLKDFTHPMMLASRTNAVKQAAQRLERTKIENKNNLIRAQASLDAQETARRIIERRLERYKEQLAFCTIKAPQAGLVVYNGTGSRDTPPIQEGTQVRERQVLLRLPDTSAMKAVVRINESQVIRLQPDQRAVVRVTGMREPIGASLTRISPVSDSVSRSMNPDNREYPVELTLDWTPPNLKPGIGAQVEILVDSVKDAVTIPLGAIYSAGSDNFVFSQAGEGANPIPRKVDIGAANETHARVVEGVRAGEQVVLLQAGQGRDLLERAGIQPAPADQPKMRKPGKGKNGPPGSKPDAAHAAVDAGKVAAPAAKPAVTAAVPAVSAPAAAVPTLAVAPTPVLSPAKPAKVEQLLKAGKPGNAAAKAE